GPRWSSRSPLHRSTGGPPTRWSGPSPTRSACVPGTSQSDPVPRAATSCSRSPTRIPASRPGWPTCVTHHERARASESWAQRLGASCRTAAQRGSGMSDTLTVALLLGAAVLLVAVTAVRFSTRLGLPSLLVYLALGMAIGEAGLGIRFDDAGLTRTLGTCALLVIIAEGGLTARWSTLRPVLGVTLVLSTAGVGASVAVVGVVAHYLLRVDWRVAF